MQLRFFIFIITLFSALPTLRALDFYDNEIYAEDIETVMLHPVGYPFATPIIQLGSQDQLLLQFDEMGLDVTDFQYTVVQCDALWKPTMNSPFEFIDGFSEGFITDFDFSFNTKQNYVNYKLNIPNNDFNITQSGNYALIIYENSVDKPTLIRRFMISNAKVQIQNAGIAVTRNPALRDQLQEIVFEINHEGFTITNPFQEITVIVTQNDRWDNAIYDIKPRHINENRLSFNYNLEIAFPPAKEFREFDIRSLRYRTERVRAIDVRDSTNMVYLMPDNMRQNEAYRYEGDGDLNGKFVIDVQEGRNEDLEADYADVHFFLPFENKISNGSFHVIGGFNDFRIGDNTELIYNHQRKVYETAITLKQGFYNYMYVFVPDDAPDVRDHSLTEGNFYDTENDFAIYIYYRSFGQRYDELIGVQFINSRLNRF